VTTAVNRRREHEIKTEFTTDEKVQFHINFPGYNLPKLSNEATSAPTLFLDELHPDEWCRVYPLLCAWEIRHGPFPNKLSKWTDECFQHHYHFVTTLTRADRKALVARANTKEIVFPKYQTQRLLHALSQFKAKLKPTFAKPDKPSIEEWLLLMSKDEAQRARLNSGRVRARVVFYVHKKWLDISSPALHADVVDMTGHPGLASY
jgi:hypothetical protein